MPIIDYDTPVGKLRMRLGDISDLPFLPDSVYLGVYNDCGKNLNKAVVQCGSMILGQLSYKTHRRMNQLEVFGNEAFKQFKEFLILTVKNPSFMDLSPIPLSTSAELNPLIQFQQDWNKNFTNGTESQQLAFNATLSPNLGGVYE